MTLYELNLHQEAQISNLRLQSAENRLNLLCLGLTPGSHIVHVAGTHRTRLFYVDERYISLRDEEMKNIEVVLDD